MGIFGTIKNRLGGGDQEDYDREGEVYGSEENYEEELDEAYYDDGYYDDTADTAAANSGRKTSVFNDFTPLVSMSDVRSQELPRYAPPPSNAQTRQASSKIRTSLPFVGDPTEALKSDKSEYSPRYSTGPLNVLDESTLAYKSDDSSDDLLKRHSLSNTGDFSATSPAYYASRSGVGHVRPAGQTRKTNKFRETIVIVPASYAEAEQVAANLRRGNAVILVLSQTRPELAKRILDFSFGAAAVTEGQVASIGERIYALTCDHPLTNTEMELLHSRGIL